jgi:hypothetical protein
MKVTRLYTWLLQSAIVSGIAASSSIEKDTQNLSSFVKLNTTAAPVATATANGLELSLDGKSYYLPRIHWKGLLSLSTFDTN